MPNFCLEKHRRTIFLFVRFVSLVIASVLIYLKLFPSPPAHAEPDSQAFCPIQGSGFLPSTPLQEYQISPNLGMQWGHPLHAFEEIGQRNYSFIINQPYTHELTPDNIKGNV